MFYLLVFPRRNIAKHKKNSNYKIAVSPSHYADVLYQVQYRLVTPILVLHYQLLFFVRIHFSISLRDGSSNITSSIKPSIIERSPRAPVLRSIAFSQSQLVRLLQTLTQHRQAPIVLELLNKCIFGFVKISTRASSSSGSRFAITGRRPINSGIKPNLKRSSGNT